MSTASTFQIVASSGYAPEESDTVETGGTIVVVGCGFVGSVFTDEYLKRAFAGKLPYALRFIDYDTVEERNCANQNFYQTDAGKYKAEVMYEKATASGRYAEYRTEKLVPENIDALLEGAVLVVDGVDNLATRQLLWGHAQGAGVPVLHLGISEQGTGKVEWSHPDHNTFSLAPQHTAGKDIVDPKSGVTPPCELARMRGVGLNVGFAAAMAAAIYFGFDPESHLKGEATDGTLTEWDAMPMGHMPRPETWGAVTRAAAVAVDAAVPAGV